MNGDGAADLQQCEGYLASYHSIGIASVRQNLEVKLEDGSTVKEVVDCADYVGYDLRDNMFDNCLAVYSK